jgi:NAD(P)-dependent dehydrogenase (short-subunit alcohol dehydrogenase family)
MTPHSLDLSGHVALVTGGNRGLGRTLIDRLAQGGAAISVVGRDGDSCEAAAAELKAAGHTAIAVKADLHSASDITAAIAETVARLGRLDILINNAGVYPHSSLLELPDDEWDDVFAVNLRGAFIAIRESVRQMVAQGDGGRIVNIASVDAIAPEPRFSHYDASKGGLVALTRSLALELGEHDITINAVGPGLIDGPGLDEFVPKRKAAFLDHVPLKSIGSPDDIADAVVFLSSGMARWITGQTLYVDGGVMLAGYMWGVDE